MTKDYEATLVSSNEFGCVGVYAPNRRPHCRRSIWHWAVKRTPLAELSSGVSFHGSESAFRYGLSLDRSGVRENKRMNSSQSTGWSTRGTR